MPSSRGEPSSGFVKIGFVLYDYYPFGGLQEDCLATALATVERGHVAIVFTRTWKGDRPDDLNIVLFGKRGWTNTSRNEHFFADLKTAIPAHQLDGVVAFNRIPHADIYYAADPCYLERCREMSFWQRLSPRHHYYASLERRMFGKPDHPTTLVLTAREIDAFAKHYPIDRTRFHLLPPGVRKVPTPEKAGIIRQTLRGELNTPDAATVVLFVGSGFRIKGLDRAIKAMSANRSAAEGLEFWVVGNGKNEKFQRLADQSGVNVRFFGGRADADRFYQSADCLLHPAYSESAGKVLLEALTHGLPVLTTDTCGYAAHIMKAGAGDVIPSPFDQNKLNETLQSFILDAGKRRTMQRNALDYAATEDLYSCHQTAATWIETTLQTIRG